MRSFNGSPEGSDPYIKRVTMNSLREGLEKFQTEVNKILLGEREEREETIWDRMNDWCEDQLTSWGAALDRHYGLWCVGLLVFLVTVLSITVTVRLM